ncbi:hypothetical protein ACQY0O_005585 [Thecaphora frezii]
MARHIVLRLVSVTLAILLVHATSVYADPMRGGSDTVVNYVAEMLGLDSIPEAFVINYVPEEAASSFHAANQQAMVPAETAPSYEPPYRFTQDFEAPNIPNLAKNPALPSDYWPPRGTGNRANWEAQVEATLDSLPIRFGGNIRPTDLVPYEAALLKQASELLNQKHLDPLRHYPLDRKSQGVYADEKLAEWLFQVLRARQNRAMMKKRKLPTYVFELQGIPSAHWMHGQNYASEVSLAWRSAKYTHGRHPKVVRTNKGAFDTTMEDVLKPFDIGPYTVALLSDKPKWALETKRIVAVPTDGNSQGYPMVHFGLLKLEKLASEPLKTEPETKKPRMERWGAQPY